MHEIPRSHPRYESLIVRERLVEGFRKGLVVPQGLIAQGRGEAFDYILGEKSHGFALQAERVAVAFMLLAERPVISVNGNYAALAASEIAELQKLTGALVEVNLFYRSEERIKRIYNYLRENGVEKILDPECEKTHVPGLESPRGIVCRDGIAGADFVLLAIEDGDRTEALVAWGKKVAAIDLNPFSRTAQKAHITIVDEAIRATRNMAIFARELREYTPSQLKAVITGFNNELILSAAFSKMLENLSRAVDRGHL